MLASYTAGPYEGQYRRTAARSRYHDRYTGFRQSVSASFNPMRATDVGAITITCDLFEGRVDVLGVAEVIQTPMTYACVGLDADGAAIGNLILEAPPTTELRVQSRRSGRLSWRGLQNIISPRSTRSRALLPRTEYRLGIPLSRMANTIGAVKLDGRPSVTQIAELPTDDQEAVAVAATMLALLIDPATI